VRHQSLTTPVVEVGDIGKGKTAGGQNYLSIRRRVGEKGFKGLNCD